MFGFTTRRLRADLAAARAETARQRKRAENAISAQQTAEFNREQILRQLADASAANRRLHDRNLALGRRLSALGEADPEYAAALERRLRIARAAGRRILTAYSETAHRANALQARLDDACGLNSSQVEAGRRWQQTRDDKRTPKGPTS